MPEPAAPAQPPLVAIRDAEPGDLNFILKSALLALRNASASSWHVANEHFFPGEERALKRILARARVLIAHPPDDPDLIAGFLVAEPPTLVHFVYTKAALRRQGVARALLAAAGMDADRGFIATASTYDTTKGWAAKRFPRVQYNPYPRWE